MQNYKHNRNRRKMGMSLAELIVSTTILTMVVAGVSSSAILFANIATGHENRADFAQDIRSGVERMSFDIRNASGVSERRQHSFELDYPDGGSVVYEWEKNNKQVVRKEDGDTEVIFGNIANFDLLVNEADEPSNGALRYSSDEVSIEELTFQSGKGKSGNSGLTVENFTFRIRNG